MSKIYLTTLGCPKNQVDSEHLKRLLRGEGFSFSKNPDDANILIVNTCAFIKEAKQESIDEIFSLVKNKIPSTLDSTKIEKKSLLVFGCLAQRYKDALRKEIPEIDHLWGVGQEKEIIQYCKNIKFEREDTANKLTEHHQTEKNSYAYLKIAEGCDKKCTFCVIPSIRGRFRSIPPDFLIEEAENYIKKGIKELILVAQDITSYGKDLKGYNLKSLLDELSKIEGNFWIRLLYLYPTSITDELIDYIAQNEKICKYLDIPFQHSEDRVLRLMGRRGIKKDYYKLLRKIKRSIPEVAIRTTFIVGFPTETEEEFLSLIDFIEDIRFESLGAFKYSKEEGTSAEKIKGHIPEKVKHRRYDELMKRQALISLQINKEMVNKRFTALIDEIDFSNNFAIARLYRQAPEIDGVVLIKDLRNQHIDIGDFCEVEIIEAYDYDLGAKIIERKS
ncbi:MAG: 30S ribosomal protein S12 methylthiotransferase RimO [Thermodesulfovibrionales bacterium]|nr:30S ribosomal protein S12 methylthiotransferase RimO [Thermodesulfovibrionales bacterium]